MLTPLLPIWSLPPRGAWIEIYECAVVDIAKAGRVTGPIAFTAPAAAEGEDEAADVTVAESELGEPPAKKPKK